MNKPSTKSPRSRYPDWIRTQIHVGCNRKEVAHLIKEHHLHTVCQSARCPNLADCWHRKTATFMILGDRCTRNCRFCAVDHRPVMPPDPTEAYHIAQTVKKLNLSFVVLTSVDRDDLPDFGSNHWAHCIQTLHQELPEVGIEALIPDFQENHECINRVIQAKPVVLGHNLETCRRLTPQIRSQNQYERSLNVLKTARYLASPQILIKSGFMVGLGETDEEVLEMMHDLLSVGVQLLTIGQYLRPSEKQVPIARFVEPEKFMEWERYAKEIGFLAVYSGPLIRSSYKAEQMARQVLKYYDTDWRTWNEGSFISRGED